MISVYFSLDDAVAIVELHHLLHPNYKLSVEARQKNLEGMPLVLVRLLMSMFSFMC